MATPMSSPNILWQMDVRRFEYTFQWAGGKFTGEAMLVLNNNRVLSQLPKTGYHHKILEGLERTEFKGFARNHSERQRRLFKSSGGENGFLFIRFFPMRIRITAEPEVVVWKDDSAGGFAIEAMKTPNPFDQSSEEPSASIIQSVGSPGKHGGFRPQVTQPDQFAPSQSKVVPMPAGDAPHDGDKVESPSRKLLQNRSRYLRWDGKENSRLHTNQAPTTTEFRYAPEEVVRNDDSPDGSTTDPTNLRETPDSNIEPSSASPQTSIPCSLASPEEVIHRVQPTLSEQTALSSPPRSPQVPATSTSVVPRNRNGKKRPWKPWRPWSTEEDGLVANMLMGLEPFCQAKFPGRTPDAIQSRSKTIRKKLIAEGKSLQRGGSSVDYKRQTFVTIASRYKDGKSEDDVIKALPKVSKQVICDEYRYLKMDKGENLDGEVKAWLEENRRARWQDIRHRFPGLGIRQFERVCARLQPGQSTQRVTRILWNKPGLEPGARYMLS
ncbi:hypothetical protein NCS56_00144000 [Fusarium sp. Ph1]|nr:hypothetical protein NCS56_00144000 [Fusarium sp. Ph1]